MFLSFFNADAQFGLLSQRLPLHKAASNPWKDLRKSSFTVLLDFVFLSKPQPWIKLGIWEGALSTIVKHVINSLPHLQIHTHK